jgi:threonine/homoserine/homoserine lactone efflux protein
MLMVRAATNDTRGALGFGVGYAIGGLLIIAAVCFGLSAWLTAVPEEFEYSKYVIMAYILWLASGIWEGGFDMNGTVDVEPRRVLPSIGAGVATCAISLYLMILFNWSCPA